MNKTDPKHIQFGVEHLHKDAKDIKSRQDRFEEENKMLRKTIHDYEEVLGAMEVKVSAMIEDGTIKISEQDVSRG